MARSHYDLLGIAAEASLSDIEAAFRDKLAALKEKPGVSPEAIAALREAYQTLANPERRAQYDESLPRPAARRVAKPAAAEGPEPEGLLARLAGAGWATWAAAILVAIAAFWWWKSRPAKPVKPPPARVVQQKVLQSPTGEPPVAEREPSAPQAAPSSAEASVAASPAARRSAEDVFAQVSGSVARVQVADGSGRTVGQGSAVVIEAGKVITNCHVAKAGIRLTVKLGKAVLPAKLQVADEEFDLCSLSVEGLAAPAVELGRVSALRTGQRVYAIGAPQGLELTISEGIVSALREVPSGTVIQTTAPISPGSSGGGLFDADGKLVGVMTFQHRFGQNLNFAVPADWIPMMRSRTASQSVSDPVARDSRPPQEPEDDSPEALVVGKWWCFGSLSGRNGEYRFLDDGRVRLDTSDGTSLAGFYRVSGKRVLFNFGDNRTFAFQIEELNARRMVLHIGVEGQRLVCERR